MREEELPASRGSSVKPCVPCPDGVDQRGGGAVHHVARRHLIGAGARARPGPPAPAHGSARSEKIVPTAPLTSRFDEPSTGSQQTTSGWAAPSASSRWARRPPRRRRPRRRRSLGARPRTTSCAPDVELLHLVAGHVDPADVAEPVTQRGVGQLLGDDGGDAAEPAHDRGHAAGMRALRSLAGLRDARTARSAPRCSSPEVEL